MKTIVKKGKPSFDKKDELMVRFSGKSWKKVEDVLAKGISKEVRGRIKSIKPVW